MTLSDARRRRTSGTGTTCCPAPWCRPVAYASQRHARGEHRGLPSPWITFIVSVDGPVRVSGTVAEGDRFDPASATSYDVIVAGLHPVAARVEQPAEQAGVQLALHPLAAPAAARLPRGGAARTRRPRPRGARSRRARELHDRVARAADDDERLDVVQDWVRDAGRRGAGDPPCGPSVVRAWQLLAGERRSLPGRGRRPRGAAQPTPAAHADGGRDRALAQAAGRQFRFDRVIARLADGRADPRRGRRGDGVRRPEPPHPRVPADGRLQPDAVAGRGAPKHPRRRAPQPTRLRP